MQFSIQKIIVLTAVLATASLAVSSQTVTRELKLGAGAAVTVVNHFGRVTVEAEPLAADQTVGGKLTASSAGGALVAESDLKIIASSGRLSVEVAPKDPRKRIDLHFILPERSTIKIETLAGAVEVTGNLAVIDANTDTGTVAVDVPLDDLAYRFFWTESHPRYLADLELSPIKEKTAGRFEIKGRLSAEGKNQKAKGKTGDGEISQSVVLDFTTARGIILLNVPPGEVMSDLRERPLTEAAKAIVRSGDSLLMEAIRRASPRYFGDYARTLPPVKREPVLLAKAMQADGPVAERKTALVRVTDLKNRAIAGLDAKDFVVTENGAEREITSVTRSTAPFNLVLLLDVSGSVENYVDFIRKTARNFVGTVDGRDRVSIIIFNDDVKVLSKFTTDKGKLSASLDTFDAGGGTAYYDALAYTLSDTLRPLKGERTAIVILTDGDDNRSFLAFDSLLGSVQESGALIYPLYVPSALIAMAAQNENADIDPLRKKYMSLTAKSEGEGDKLASVSGGVYYPITQISQIRKAYEDIVLQLRTAYSVTFRSETQNAGAGVSPRLKVKVKKDNAFATVNSVADAGDK